MKNLGSVMLAYMIGWGVFFVYFVSVAQRTSALRKELERLKNSVMKSDASSSREPVTRGR
jgi:CcmD family protein